MEILKLKNAITKIRKKILEGLNYRFKLAKVRNSKPEDKSRKIMQTKKKRIKKKPQRNVGHFKCIKVYILGIPEREERKKQEKKKSIEVMTITSQVYWKQPTDPGRSTNSNRHRDPQVDTS